MKVPRGFTTIGVLFPGSNQVYTYLIRRGHRCKPGYELVVDAPHGGPKVVFVVRVDKKPEHLDSRITYKTVRRKVVEI